MKTRLLTLITLVALSSSSLANDVDIIDSRELLQPQDSSVVEPSISINQRLSSTENRGSIVVTEVDDAKEIISSIKNASRADFIRGYRVGIFFDNGQNARQNAVTIKKNFTSLYPDIKVYVTYENPYFRVAAGDCIVQEEAVILLEKIRPNFPKAFIQRDNIAIEDL